MGLSAVLDLAKPSQRILVVSYGSGAGSDAFVIEVTGNIKKRHSKVKLKEMIAEKEYIDYITYIKNRKKIKSM